MKKEMKDINFGLNNMIGTIFVIVYICLAYYDRGFKDEFFILSFFGTPVAYAIGFIIPLIIDALPKGLYWFFIKPINDLINYFSEAESFFMLKIVGGICYIVYLVGLRLIELGLVFIILSFLFDNTLGHAFLQPFTNVLGL